MTFLKKLFATCSGITGVGAFIGVFAPLLQKWGNPANMGVCVACFERDIAGALGLHRAAVVQYMRPEIIGFVLGSLIAAYLFSEFRARAGSAPIVRFILGAFAMIGALVFLGCPWWAMLRLTGGDDLTSPFAHKLSSTYYNLTFREVEVANLVKEGKTNKEIAELLNISPRTVKFHRDNLRKKLGIRNTKTNLRSHLFFLQ